MTGDCHALFWGSPGVTPPGHPTLVLGDEMALRRVVIPRDHAHEAGLDDDPPGLQLDVLPLDEGAERRVVRPEVLAEFAARAHPLGERLARAPRVGG